MADLVAPVTKTTEDTKPIWLIENASNWPGAFGAYKYSKPAVRYNIWTWFGWIVVLGTVQFVIQAIIGNKTGATIALNQIVSLIVGSISSTIYTLTFIMSVRRQKLPFGQALTRSLPLFFNMLLLTIVSGAIIVLSLLLLIVPFFFVAPRLALATYYLVDKDLGPIESIKSSWATTKGHSGKVYGIIGAYFVMALPLLTIIGAIATVYFWVLYSAVFAVLYEYLLHSQPIETAPLAVQPVEASSPQPPVTPPAV